MVLVLVLVMIVFRTESMVMMPRGEGHRWRRAPDILPRKEGEDWYCITLSESVEGLNDVAFIRIDVPAEGGIECERAASNSPETTYSTYEARHKDT